MAKPEKLPSGHTASMLDWSARQIGDPVARLKYLREASNLAFTVETKVNRNRKWAAIAGVVVAAVLLAVPVIPRLASAWRAPERIKSLGAPPAPLNGDIPEVWQVEKTPAYEVYSNGLRVETEGVVMGPPRRFIALDRKHPEEWKNAGVLTNYRTDPVGIVFHTTESDMLPFEQSQSQNLKRAGENVLSYVRNIKAYHYLVDRFGRVHQALAEEGIAHHAGSSVWADRDSVYVNLNHSFLAVSFEAQTRPQDGSDAVTKAQVHAGRVLVDMLRSRYKIRSENCTTHGQVSVNPANWLIGAHTDWATRFPYEEMGLPDNYSVPIPAITTFGFSYDPAYVQASEARLWKGLLFADEEVRKAASAQNLKVSPYRAILNQRYKETTDALNQQQK